MWWTLCAAAIASSTALLVAFGAYPWQKRKDRELQLQAEMRGAFIAFERAVMEAYFTTGKAEFRRKQFEVRKEFNGLLLFAEQELINEAENVATELINLHTYMVMNKIDGPATTDMTFAEMSFLAADRKWLAGARRALLKDPNAEETVCVKRFTISLQEDSET